MASRFYQDSVIQLASDSQVVINHEQRDSWFAVSVKYQLNFKHYIYKCKVQVEPGYLGLVENLQGNRAIVTVVDCRVPTDSDCLIAHKWFFPIAVTEEELQKVFTSDEFLLQKVQEAQHKKAVSDRLQEVLGLVTLPSE